MDLLLSMYIICHQFSLSLYYFLYVMGNYASLCISVELANKLTIENVLIHLDFF